MAAAIKLVSLGFGGCFGQINIYIIIYYLFNKLTLLKRKPDLYEYVCTRQSIIIF